MGKYEVERFLTAPDPDLICCVCYCILDDPLESPCQHVFCKVCIYTWLDNRKSCPNCRTRLRACRLKAVLPIVRNMINRLQIRCENVDNGCTNIIILENYSCHIQNCNFTFVTCKNVNCHDKILHKDVEQHELQCLHRLIKCEKGCGLLLSIDKIADHNCLAELKDKLSKVEENLQAVNTKMTDVDKRMQVLERHHRRTRSNRSPSVVLSSSLVPWLSSNSRRRRSTSRSRNNSRRRHRPQRRSRSQNRNRLRSTSRNRSRLRSRSNSPWFRRFTGGQWRFAAQDALDQSRRSRSRSWSLFQSSTSQSPSRSPERQYNNRRDQPIILSPGSWSSYSHSSSVTSAVNSGSNNSSGDESFYSEMNRSFSSESLVSASSTHVIESNLSSNQDEEIVDTLVESQVHSSDTLRSSVEEHERAHTDSATLNTSNEVELLSIESENNDEPHESMRRSCRLAAKQNPADEGSSDQHSTPHTGVPILSRSTIEAIMGARAESSDGSSWGPNREEGSTDYTISDEEEICNSCDTGSTNDITSSDRDAHWSDLLRDYNSSETDDTWSLPGNSRGSGSNKRNRSF